MIDNNRSGIGRTKLREVVTTIETEMSRLSSQLIPQESGSGMGVLFKHWATLVTLLDLGQPPELRECPVCRQLGMREATRCGYCWAKLEPPDRSHATA
jgi:hypothetical protein